MYMPLSFKEENITKISMQESGLSRMLNRDSDPFSTCARKQPYTEYCILSGITIIQIIIEIKNYNYQACNYPISEILINS